jgi:Uma2 family endonuclease
MAMATAPTPPRTRRFTSDEVWKMVEVGLLGEDEPYELIDGELLYVNPPNPPHDNVSADLTTRLVMAYGEDYRVRVGGALGGIVDSIPEPDFAVIPSANLSDTRRVVASEMLLVVEISDRTRRRDIRKGAIYAAAGAPEYWRVDVNTRTVHVHRGPRADGTWAETCQVGLDGELRLPGIAATLAVAAFLAPR